MDALTKRIEELTARAKSRGLSVRSVSRQMPRPRRGGLDFPSAQPTPIQRAMQTRRQPSWLPMTGDYNVRNAKERRRDQWARATCWLIAKALGPEWGYSVESPGTYCQGLRLIHKSGLHITMSHPYGCPDHMWRFTPLNTRHQDKIGSIQAGASKSPIDLANDIRRRILEEGAIESVVAEKRDTGAQRDKTVKARLAMLTLARAVGGQIAPDHHYRSGQAHTTRESYGGRMVTIDGEKHRSGGIRLQGRESGGFSGYELIIESFDLEALTKLASYAKEIAYE